MQHVSGIWVIHKLMTNLNLLEGTVDHGDEHVEEHYHHGNVVHPVQHITSVLNEFVSVVDDNRPDLGEAKYSPEQRLEALLQAAQGSKRNETGGKLFWIPNKLFIIMRETLKILSEKLSRRHDCFF